MATIQIKHIPEEVHTILHARAASAGQSLQEYLLNKLSRDTQTPTLSELFEVLETRVGGNFSLEDVSELIREDRNKR